ncbi:hypothetical protein LG322_00370 [Microbacterium aerolatum]|uniref:hypothetical protein n=1 Tax=Microbacterium aerolatum TaxID=153731 RepID=UPI00384D4A41
MTDEAPDRYTVEAVFTRRPGRDEITEILGSETRERLAKAGYSTVEVTISDRRLEIANTNLEELRDGLGGVLADRLAEITEGARAKQDAAAIRFREAAAGEQDRAASVVALAESVTFRTSETRVSETDQLTAATDDRARIDDWTDEGGHGR